MPRARERRRLKRKVNSSRYACRCPGLTPPWWVPSSQRCTSDATRCTPGSSSWACRPRRGDRLGLVGVLLATGRRVAWPPVGNDDRSGIDVIQEEGPERGGARVVDDLHAAAAKRPSGLFYGDCDQRLAQRAASWTSRLRAADDRLVNLDDRAQPVATATDHRGAVAMQHRPRGLLGADPEYALQAVSGDPVLLAGHLPRRREPHRQRRARAVEDRPGRRRDTTTAAPTGPPTVRELPRLLARAQRAAEALRPAQPVQVVQARPIIREPAPQIGVRGGVVDQCPGLLSRHSPRLLH